jgi:hypothetical protein
MQMNVFSSDKVGHLSPEIQVKNEGEFSKPSILLISKVLPFIDFQDVISQRQQSPTNSLSA